MRVAASERLGLFRFALASFCVLALSACGLSPRVPGVQDFDVSIPEFAALEGLQQINAQREKVADIEFIAPPRGTVIVESRAYGLQGFTRVSLNSDYLLEEDTEPLLREAAARVFEIDPNAKTRIRLELMVDGLTYKSGASLCTEWTSKITSTFVVTEIMSDGQEASEEYWETASETDCDTVIIPMPTGAAFESPLQESFAKALLKMINSRGAQTTSSTRAS